MTRAIHNYISAMGYRQCALDNHVSLTPSIAAELEKR